MIILGISAFYHDSAAALAVDGTIIAAAQEERFTRKKHDPSFPSNAIAYCLNQTNISLSDVDYVAFYDKPFLKFERLLETYLTFAPRGMRSFRMAIPVWIREKLFQKNLLRKKLNEFGTNFDLEKLLFLEHHISHAASAFYPSPFKEAAVLTMDGVGEWATTTLAIGNGIDLNIRSELQFPHSLGLLYSAFTYYTGFKVNSGEYKLMGLAPYGQPRFKETILKYMIDLKPDGTFKIDQSFFDYCTGLKMTSNRIDRLFGQPARKPEETLTQFHMDIAASIQQVTEEVILRLARSIRNETGIRNLCLAGGVALNCVANGRLHRERIFDRIWVQPAAGDAGGAVGAALAAHHLGLRGERTQIGDGRGDGMNGSYLGPCFSDDEIERQLTEAGAKFVKKPDGEIIGLTARSLADGNAVGWFQGRMEFGPRSLGNRSILADPRSSNMQRNLNLKIKYRESFRPFAPAVLREQVSEWFELDDESPYMLLVADVRTEHRIAMTEKEQGLFGINKLNVARSKIPAVTHVDYSARIQTVDHSINPLFHSLISEFRSLTGCPILVNTSFNVRGEPIVCSPRDAFRCFMGSELDVLVVGNILLRKEDQDPRLKLDYKTEFELD